MAATQDSVMIGQERESGLESGDVGGERDFSELDEIVDPGDEFSLADDSAKPGTPGTPGSPGSRENTDATGTSDGVDGAGGLDDAMIARAQEAGLSDEDMRDLTPTEMGRVLDLYDRRIAALGKPTEKELPKADAVDKDAVDKADNVNKPEGGVDLKLLDDVAEPEVIAAFKAMSEEVNTLHSKLIAMETAGRRESESRLFTGLPDEQQKLFEGKDGDGNRRKVLDEMAALRAGYQALKRDVPADTELFQRAVRLALSDQVAAAGTRKLVETVRNREGRFVQRPTQREAQLTPDQRSIAALTAKMRDIDFGDEEGLEDVGID